MYESKTRIRRHDCHTLPPAWCFAFFTSRWRTPPVTRRLCLVWPKGVHLRKVWLYMFTFLFEVPVLYFIDKFLYAAVLCDLKSDELRISQLTCPSQFHKVCILVRVYLDQMSDSSRVRFPHRSAAIAQSRQQCIQELPCLVGMKDICYFKSKHRFKKNLKDSKLGVISFQLGGRLRWLAWIFQGIPRNK